MSNTWLEAKCDACGETIFAERIEPGHLERAERFGKFWMERIQDHTVDGCTKAPRTLPAIPQTEINTFNRFGVAVGHGGVVLLAPPVAPMTETEALTLAAWLVALAGGAEKFAQHLAAVEST